ncbi:MAG: acyltransferase [Thermoplasmata archaeon]
MSKVPGRLGVKLRRAFFKKYFKHFGSHVTIAEDVTIEVPENISIGDNSGFNAGCWISGGGGLTIGHNVIVGPHTVIHTQNHEYDDVTKPICEQGHTSKPVTIEDDVWIGARAVITPGSKIGRGCVIAAGAVVAGYITPHSVAAGVPAKVIKKRGTDPESKL